MQTPALFKPMNLGEGFGFFDDFDYSDDVLDVFAEPTFYDPFANDPLTGQPYDPDLVFSEAIINPPFSALDAGADVYPNVAIVDNAGNVNNKSGNQIISASTITNIAKKNPGREGEAIAKTLASTAPDYTKQFKSYDELVKASYNLFNTTKAVIQGKPIPQSIRSPYVYNPNDPNMVRRTTTAMPAISTNMLLIGGVALAAFLVLRKK